MGACSRESRKNPGDEPDDALSHRRLGGSLRLAKESAGWIEWEVATEGVPETGPQRAPVLCTVLVLRVATEDTLTLTGAASMGGDTRSSIREERVSGEVQFTEAYTA